MKKYKTGLVLGRFQTFHKGHEYIINKALEICDKVINCAENGVEWRSNEQRIL